MEVDLIDCIGTAYYDLFWDIEDKKHLHYLLGGGRGSLKSSFAFIYTIYSMTRDALNGDVTHTVALRKVKDTIYDSVFENLLWAIDILGLSSYWHYTKSPMRIWFQESTILFRGCANQRDYEKIKSIKFKKGYCKIALFEELTEFSGMDEIRQILASLFRGGDDAIAFYMYNPPASCNNWVNKESKIEMPNRRYHHSTYKEAPREWLGEVFFQEAETLKLQNYRKYSHMYLGEEIGEGLEIYPAKTKDNPNGVLELRTITDEEIKQFDKIDRGLDFGYSHASCYLEAYYDKQNDIVYVIDEVYLYGAANFMLATKIKEKAGGHYINGDSEDPRTINEMNLLKLNVGKAKKGKDSKPHGIKWIQDRSKIVCDKKRTPNVAADLQCYEYKKDKDGNIIYDFPDEPDGSAALRYALERYIIDSKIKFGVKR
jgi:PBSX family phage terminase large subunit